MTVSKNDLSLLDGGIALSFPFRLGTSSYIIPADIIPNVRALAGIVDDIELVLFETEEFSNLPDADTIDTLRVLAKEHELSYTVHFPLDVSLCDSNEECREKSVEQCRRIIDCTRPLDPFAFIVHCNEDSPEGEFPSRDMETWLKQAHRSFGELSSCVDDPKCFAVETLRYPLHTLETPIREHGFSVCLDIGHLLLNSYSIEEHYRKYWDITRVIHLHGIIDGKDHASLKGLDKQVLEILLNLLKTTAASERVLTLEIFSESDFIHSMEILERYAER